MKDQLKRKLDADPFDSIEQSKKKKQKKDKMLKKQKETNSNEILNGCFEIEQSAAITENVEAKQNELKGQKKKKKKQSKTEENAVLVSENKTKTDCDDTMKEKENVTKSVTEQLTAKTNNKKKKDKIPKESVENTGKSIADDKLKNKKDKQKKKKTKDFKTIPEDDPKENQESSEITEKDTKNDELIYRLLGDKPDKISTLNGFQKKLIRLSLLAANDVEKSDDQIEVVTKMKEKHQKEFRKAIDRGISKGVPIVHIDTGHSRSVKFDEDSD